MRTLTSHDGVTLPVLGFGTYTLTGDAGSDAVERAIAHGYTLIDSAFSYENEGAVGRAVRASLARGRERGELVVASKLPGRHHERGAAIAAIEESVARTGLDALDLYLVHWPNPRRGRYVEAWRALIEAKERGLVRAIGVCNFLPEHLDRLIAETDVVPAVHQIELHPYLPQEEQLAYDRERGILTQAWSPLAKGGALLREAPIARAADMHGATHAQVVLAWAIARGAVPIPKARSSERQLENLGAVALALDGDEVAEITALGSRRDRSSGLHPAVYEEL